jgi:hypothetical protein
MGRGFMKKSKRIKLVPRIIPKPLKYYKDYIRYVSNIKLGVWYRDYSDLIVIKFINIYEDESGELKGLVTVSLQEAEKDPYYNTDSELVIEQPYYTTVYDMRYIHNFKDLHPDIE